ncbi:MAG TPA: riboflavin synthase [Solirubrobacteraceae bacterium]|nr:riboflavin synthase [Solirubrobacteraceae bacterium]
MFTGLIADLGSLTAIDIAGDGAILTIASPLAEQLRVGDSVAVNGVCLTATAAGRESFQADAMMETLERSSLGSLGEGARVNLELPLRLSDRVGGHFVQGHVDGTGTVRALREEGFARALEVDAGAEITRYLAAKGSVALDGVSLTVTALEPDGFAVALIPETLERTNLGALGEGSRVNIEVDILAKHIERLLEARA